LTRRVDWFSSGQLQGQILNVTGPPHSVGSGVLTRPKALGLAAGHGPKMLGPGGGRTQLGVGSWW